MITPLHYTGRSGGSARDAGPSRDVLGVVLAGGASTRMGVDKGRMELGGQTLVERAAKLLDVVADQVVLATGSTARYSELGRASVLDRPEHEGQGPAAGLVAALDHARSRGLARVLVLACDMPWVEREALEGLLQASRTENLDAVLFEAPLEGDESETRLEPLLAVYHVRVLGPLLRALEAGGRRMIDFHKGFGTVRVDRWGRRMGARGARWAKNVNTPEDWRELERAGNRSDERTQEGRA